VGVTAPLVAPNVTEGDEVVTNGPKFYAYTVKDRAGKKPVWTKIGSAWGHEKGGGFNIELQALPMDGRIVLMPPKDEPSGSTNGQVD
jgi:hypothetical protein